MPKQLFKILGLAFLLLCCTAFGFIKANKLKNQLEALKQIKNGLFALKECLRLHGGDKKQLLNACFKSHDTLLQDLGEDDIKVWKEFLLHFGDGDTKSEYERCLAFINLFDVKIRELSVEISEKQKLYKSLGFFSGIFLCIFFL